MKINLPGSNNNNNNNKPIKENKPKSKSKSKSNNELEDKTKNNSPAKWKEKDGFISTIINHKLIKIDLYKFDIHLPNNFKMSNNSSLEEAKEKVISLLS